MEKIWKSKDGAIIENFTEEITKRLRKGAYEAYKADWIHSHVTPEQVLDNYRNYISDAITQVQIDANKVPWSPEEYIEELGYGYESYACYDEFLENEYKDPEYMVGLIGEKNYKFLLGYDELLKNAFDL